MAIEIKELIIKMTVNVQPHGVELKLQEGFSEHVKNRIVKECVEKVMQKLESKLER